MINKLNHGCAQLAEAVKEAYNNGQNDYYLEPLALTKDGKPVGKIEDGDSVIFCCRRGEREIELTEMFTDPSFNAIERKYVDDLHFVMLTMYHEKLAHLPVAFGPEHVRKPLAEILANNGKRQLHISESEKFAHVTFFFNGGENEPFENEDDICIPSPKGIPFDQKPELSLPEVVDKLKDSFGKYDFIVTNFANGDVIGHTSNSQAKVKAAKAVSEALETVVTAALKNDYVVAVTADHGNIETLYNKNGAPHVAHTSNPVAFIMIDPRKPEKTITLKDGALSNVAPTILHVMGLEKPEEMTEDTLTTDDFGACRKMILIICDGWGIGSHDDNDAIYLAETPYWDSLLERQSVSYLHASGEYVGLGKGKPGNSEAGHSNLGAGRCVMQDDIRIDQAIANGEFMNNEVIREACKKARDKKKAVHLISYLTHKSSHGSIEYALQAVEAAHHVGVDNVYLHIIFDGRSTEPGSAPDLLMELEDRLYEMGTGLVVDGIGRGFALDRDHNWEKVKKAYDMMVLGKGTHYSI